MDSNTLTLTAIIVAVCFWPLVLIQIKKIKKNSLLMNTINKLVKENNCNVTQKEQCSDFILAIDETKKYLFFSKNNKKIDNYNFVNLSEYSICKKLSRKFTDTDKNNNLISYDIIELIFTPKSKNVAEKKIEIYNESLDVSLTGEIQLLEKWVKIINKNILAVK